MSDQFGIGGALRACAEIYFRSARRTGRSRAMIANLRDGDRVIFYHAREADRVRYLANERGLDIQTVTNDPAIGAERLFSLPPHHGRTLFDHSWIEQFYRERQLRAEQDLAALSDRLNTEPLDEMPSADLARARFES